jgi:membrane protein implicated in regulation of membrane protease activity
VWIVIWLLIALVCVMGELLTTGLFLGSVAAAALVVALSALILPVALQGLLFGALALLGIAVIRPIVIHTLGIDANDALPSPHLHIIGKHAVVTQRVDAGGGQIRIGHGEYWTARPYNGSDVIEPETSVEILLVDGLTALVAPVAPHVLAS